MSNEAVAQAAAMRQAVRITQAVLDVATVLNVGHDAALDLVAGVLINEPESLRALQMVTRPDPDDQLTALEARFGGMGLLAGIEGRE